VHREIAAYPGLFSDLDGLHDGTEKCCLEQAGLVLSRLSLGKERRLTGHTDEVTAAEIEKRGELDMQQHRVGTATTDKDRAEREVKSKKEDLDRTRTFHNTVTSLGG